MMDRKARGIDEIIQQAMQEGAFDNLPGKGKPLHLEENPYLDREWQLAYHLLKENGFAPAFIEQRQSIELELAAARETLARAWAWRTQSSTEGKPMDWVEAEWGRAKEKFEGSLEKINKGIADYNLTIPIQRLYKKIINIFDEIELIERTS
jgi:DnaJ family protein C protein 28